MQKMDVKVQRQLVNMYLLANVDDEFDEKELLAIVDKAKQYGLSSDEMFQVFQVASTYQTLPSPDALEEKVRELYELALIIWADGKIAASERDFFNKMILRYGFEETSVGGIADYLLGEAQKNREVESIIEELTANE